MRPCEWSKTFAMVEKKFILAGMWLALIVTLTFAMVEKK